MLKVSITIILAALLALTFLLTPSDAKDAERKRSFCEQYPVLCR